MKSRRALFYLLFVTFFSLGFTGQVGIQYSQLGNFQLGVKTNVPIAAPTINVSSASLSIIHGVVAALTVAVTAPSAFSSEIGAVAARAGNFALGKLPTLSVAITKIVVRTSSATALMFSITASHASVILNSVSNSLIRLVFDIEAPPGTLANLGSTISTGASLTFIYSQVTSIVIRNTINTASASIARTIQIKDLPSLTISVAHASVAVASAVSAAMSRTIAASAASVSVSLGRVATISLQIRTFIEPVQFAPIINGVGHLTTVVLPIAVSAAHVTATMIANFSKALIVAASTASVSASVTNIASILRTIAASSVAISLRAVATKAISAVITAVPVLNLAPLVLFSHIVVAKATIAAVGAQLAQLVRLTVVLQLAINASRVALALIYGRAVIDLFRITAPFGAVAISSTHIIASVVARISVLRSSVSFLFTRIIQDTFIVAANQEALNLSTQFKLSLSQTINSSRAAVSTALIFFLHFIIAAPAALVATAFREIVGPLLLTISTVRETISVTLTEALRLAQTITATAESVALSLAHLFIVSVNSTIQVTAAHLTTTFHAIAQFLLTIATATLNLAIVHSALVTTAHITASIESVVINNLVRGVSDRVQIAVLSGQLVLSDTIRAFIAATISSLAELVSITSQIRLLINQAISVISATIQLLYVNPPPVNIKIVNINAPLAPQLIPINGTL